MNLEPPAAAAFHCGLVSFDNSPNFHTPLQNFSDDLIIVDPYECHAPSRRSDAELGRVLAILDNLEQGKANN